MNRRNSTSAVRLQLETPPGCCLACDEAMPPDTHGGRPRVIHDNPECLALYNSLMCGDWRARNADKVKAASKAHYDKLKANPMRWAVELERQRVLNRKRYAERKAKGES